MVPYSEIQNMKTNERGLCSGVDRKWLIKKKKKKKEPTNKRNHRQKQKHEMLSN